MSARRKTAPRTLPTCALADKRRPHTVDPRRADTWQEFVGFQRGSKVVKQPTGRFACAECVLDLSAPKPSNQGELL